jgi:chorismate mutase
MVFYEKSKIFHRRQEIFQKKITSSSASEFGSERMEELSALRCEIDLVDRKIMELFEERFKIVERIKEIKKKKKIPIEDLKREEEIKKRFKEKLLPKGYVEKVMDLNFSEAKK